MGLLRWLMRIVGAGTATYGYGKAGTGAVLAAGVVEGDSERIDPTTGAEPSDIHAPAVMLTGILLLVALGAITGLLYFVFAYFTHERAVASPPPLASHVGSDNMPPEPRLQQSPVLEMKSLRAHEDQILNSYSWADKGRGIVSIPIQRAIEIVAHEGIPPQAGAGGVAYYPPQAGSRRTGFEGKVEPEPR